MKKKIWFVLFIMVLLLILLLSFQSRDGSVNLTEYTLELFRKVATQIGISQEQIALAWWNDFKHMRRLAHIGEYVILGVVIALWFKSRNRNKIWQVVIVCLVISFLDQCIKCILPTREFEGIDMIFDAVGYVAGSGIVYLGAMLGARH